MKDLTTEDEYTNLPVGYMATERGISLVGDNEFEDFAEGPWLCSRIQVLGSGCRENGTDWGRVVEITDPRGAKHVVCLFNANSATEHLKILKSRGLRINADVPRVDKVLAKLLTEWNTPDQYLFVDRLGWADDACTTFTFAADKHIGTKKIFLMCDTGNEMRRHVKGSLDDWKTSVAALCVGNPVMVFSVSIALAAPFMQLLNRDSFTVHLRGRSSCGKTTALRVANSVWNPPCGLQNWRTTSNGLESVAVAANSTLLTLDELGQVSATAADEASYMLGNERGKRRARTDGSGSPCKTWKLIALSSGEISLAEKVSEGGKVTKLGQEVRFIDIEADTYAHGIFSNLCGEPDGNALAKKLNAAVKATFGTPGYAMVKFLTVHQKKVTAIASSFIDVWLSEQASLTPGGLDGPGSRVAQNFAIIAAAGEIATAKGFTDWPKGAAKDAATELFKRWLAAREKPVREISREILNFADRNTNKIETLGQSAIPDRVGYHDTEHLYLSSVSWKRIFTQDQSRTALTCLSDSGVLVRAGTHFSTKMGRSVPNRERHYKLLKEKLRKLAESDALNE
ncbi:DUF927 domain-containing protein [Roseivivax marinus]|uniref:DUF927 domain-containing protein n=1 Tax=Roseivivax marinus TaxID=1379903 RepID=UPI001F042A65|nr:DUF927 domain-containing protein [Roseivivax marinus]UMA64399.1 DUF927 domain-containing protein [Roseivivax marinus]